MAWAIDVINASYAFNTPTPNYPQNLIDAMGGYLIIYGRAVKGIWEIANCSLRVLRF